MDRDKMINKSISEKLGIRQIGRYKAESIHYGDSIHMITQQVCLSKDVRELEKQRNEMLEALIDIRKFMDRLPDDWYSEYRALNLERVIEGSTEKSWKQIKEMIDA